MNRVSCLDVINALYSYLITQQGSYLSDFQKIAIGYESLANNFDESMFPLIMLDDGGESEQYLGGGLINHSITILVHIAQKDYDSVDSSLLGRTGEKGILELSDRLARKIKGNPSLSITLNSVEIPSTIPEPFDFGNGLYGRMRLMTVTYKKKEIETLNEF